jgi:hypothetical protein
MGVDLLGRRRIGRMLAGAGRGERHEEAGIGVRPSLG